MRVRRSFQAMMVLAVLSTVLRPPARLAAQCGASMCAPGRSAVGGYDPREGIVRFTMPVPGTTGFEVAQRAAWDMRIQVAAMHANLRESAERWKAMSDQKKWDTALTADSAGDLPTASRLYASLAKRGFADARQRLAQIQSDFQAKWQPLEDELADLSGRDGPNPALRRARLDAEEVTKVFKAMDELAVEYAGVETVEQRIEKRLVQLRKDRQYAAILQEPAAAELWNLGQDHESKQHSCCAVLVYEQAAKLAPAPSAEQAKARMSELLADKEVATATKLCRNLQRCHANFRQAELNRNTRPERAREYYLEILQLAPADTPIYQAARQQLAMFQ